MGWFAEFLFKAVCVFAFAISLVFTIYFLAEKRYTAFWGFAFMTVVFGGLALGVFRSGDDEDQ